jgi:polyisoprenoid-binding protein YceI
MSRHSTLSMIGIAALMAAALVQPGYAQAPAPAPAAARPPPPPPSKDPMAAPAGTYKIDKQHHSIVARIGHGGGFSFSTVRFGATDGTLTWDPAHIEASKVSVTVDAKPNFAPIVYGVDPGGPVLLNTAMFPTATFVSTGIKRTGPATGQIMGDLTLMGQTKPVTIDAQLVGAGRNGRGAPIVGFTGTLKFKRGDFGFTAMGGGISNEIELVIDAEFDGPAG